MCQYNGLSAKRNTIIIYYAQTLYLVCAGYLCSGHNDLRYQHKTVQQTIKANEINWLPEQNEPIGYQDKMN